MTCGNLYSRHWFSVYGVPGLRAPTCQRCDAPNPTITEEERLEYEGFMESLRRAAATADRRTR